MRSRDQAGPFSPSSQEGRLPLPFPDAEAEPASEDLHIEYCTSDCVKRMEGLEEERITL